MIDELKRSYLQNALGAFSEISRRTGNLPLPAAAEDAKGLRQSESESRAAKSANDDYDNDTYNAICIKIY